MTEDLLRPALKALEPCPGCGSTEPLEAIQARGFAACCPDRPGGSSFIDMGDGNPSHPRLAASTAAAIRAGLEVGK
jgi:hypothetical protein